MSLFGYIYAPPGTPKKTHLHFAFTFVTVQLLSPQIYIVPSFPKPWPMVSVMSVTSRRKNSPCANASIVRGKLDLVHIFVLFNDHLNCLLLICRAISHAGACRHAVGPSGAARVKGPCVVLVIE